MNNINQYFTFKCAECGNVETVDFLSGMMARVCTECGAFLESNPDAQVAMPETPTKGLYECYDCGHVFGYATGYGDNMYDDPNCTNCGSEDVSPV